MERSLSFQARREVLQQMAPQYRQASPSQKRTLLESFIATTGYVRTYAMWLLNHAEEVQQTRERPRVRRYSPEVQQALFLVALDPIRLFQQVEQLQQAVFQQRMVVPIILTQVGLLFDVIPGSRTGLVMWIAHERRSLALA